MGQRITLGEAVDLFLLDSKAQGHTVNTQRFYAGRCRTILRWMDGAGVTYLEELTPATVRAYLAHLQDQSLSEAYIHSIARALRAFCNFCARDALVGSSPFDQVKMPRLRSEVQDILQRGEFQKLVEACSGERDRAILHTMLDTGVRASELLALDVRDVDGGTVMIRTDKGGRGRFVYIGAKTQLQLRRYRTLVRKPDEEGDALFTGRDGRRLSYWGLASIFRRLRLRTGIEVSPHMIRRSFAVQSLKNGMNIYVLARLMGHSDIGVLRSYLKYVQGDIRQAAEDFGVVDNL